MDNKKEIKKLIDILEIPIDDIVFHGSYCEIYLNNNLLGYLPIYNVSSIMSYDTNEGELAKIRWDQVFLMNQDTINKRITKTVDDDFDLVSIGTFRKLYIKDRDDKVLDTVECRFINNEWQINIL